MTDAPRKNRPKARPAVFIESLYDDRNPLYLDSVDLYNRAFPDSERSDPQYFAHILEEKRLGLLYPFNFHYLVARVDERAAGLATGHYLALVNMGFVGYLAVHPDIKGARIGSRLRQRLVTEFRRDARAAGYKDLLAIVGEVEAVNPWLKHLIRNRGAFAVDIDYRQPALKTHLDDVPLVLYVEPIARPIKRVAAEDIRKLLYEIYRRIYRIRFPLKNRTLARMMQELEGRKSIGPKKLPPSKHGVPRHGLTKE